MSRRRFLILAFCLALAATTALGVRLVVRGLYWSRHPDRPIEAWMTVGMVARSYAVPRTALAAALGLDARRDRSTVAEIAARSGQPVDAVIARLQAAVAAARATDRAGKVP